MGFMILPCMGKARSRGGGVLRSPLGHGEWPTDRISSDGMIKGFFGFEIFDSGIFLGRKIWQLYFCVA